MISRAVHAFSLAAGIVALTSLALVIPPAAAELPAVMPEAIIKKYGKPDAVYSAESEQPRPPLVTKSLTYKKENVRFTFLADAPMGSPPPYRKWKLLGMQDARTNAVIKAEEVERRMAERKPK